MYGSGMFRFLFGKSARKRGRHSDEAGMSRGRPVRCEPRFSERDAA